MYMYDDVNCLMSLFCVGSSTMCVRLVSESAGASVFSFRHVPLSARCLCCSLAHVWILDNFLSLRFH